MSIRVYEAATIKRGDFVQRQGSWEQVERVQVVQIESGRPASHVRVTTMEGQIIWPATESVEVSNDREECAA